MNPYDAVLSAYPRQERKLLLKRFYKDHHGIGDTVQLPQVISVVLAISITAFTVTLWDTLFGRVVICTAMVGCCFGLRRILEWTFRVANRNKLERFLKDISEPVAAPEPPPAAPVQDGTETMNPKPESEAPADGGGR